MNFFIYHNWRANGISYKVHTATCGFCNNGHGSHPTAEHGRNGVWIGPFENMTFVIQYCQRIDITLVEHSCIEK